MNTNKITVATTISADISKVWNYWTLPIHVVHWNFASDDWYCPNAENDLRTQGTFKYVMSSKDNKMSFDFEGIYDEVIEHQKISYSMADGRQVSISFKMLGSTTTLTETFDPENENTLELQRAGWQAILENFKKYVEAN